jgi:glycosyltransferase involved in cell wall biosynthesis
MDNIHGLPRATVNNGMRPGKLRIAFATPEFVTENHFDGGLSNYINRVSRILAANGHDVHVVTLSSKDEEEFDHKGVKVHRVMLKRGWQQLNRLTRYRFPTTLHWLNLSAQVYRKLKQLHRQTPFHLIQYSNYSSCGLFAIPLLRCAHVIRASSHPPALHDAAGLKRNVDLALVERLEVWQYKLTRNVYAPSHGLQKTLAKTRAAGDVPVIRPPFYVETRKCDLIVYDQFLKGKEYLLYFGRFQRHKGFHTLAEALPRFLNRYPNACAVLIGRDMETSSGSSMAAWARAQCGSSAERLIILENLPHRQLYPVIAGARLVVLPSLIENLPNAGLEAMALGKVVIGTTGTGFDELITDGVDGFLVTPNRSDALAEKVISAWMDPRLEQMSLAAKQRVLDFAPDKTLPPLLSYYREVIGQ